MPNQYDAQIYAPLCAEIRAVCKNKTMPRQERYDRLYMLQPLTIKERGAVDDILSGIAACLAGGGKPSDKRIHYYNSISSDVVNSASVNCVIEKARQIMEANPFSLEAVTNLRRIDRDGRLWEEKVYSGDVWPTMYDIMPDNIKLPNVPNIQYGDARSKFSESRTEEFLRLLNEESEEFIAKFILMVMVPQTNGLGTGGPIRLKTIRDKDGYILDDMQIDYSTPEQLRRFRKWYEAWDRLVPTLCQRYQFYGDTSSSPDDGGGIQAACGDLSGSDYRMSWEMTRKMQEKERRSETFGSAVSY